MEGLNSTVNTSSILLSQLDSLVKELKKDLSDERSSSLLDDIIQLTENLSAVEVGNDKDAELTSRIRASGIALWNRAVSLKTQDSTNAQLVARMRHVACNLTFTASREEESKAVIKKKLAMAMKTGRAWLDVHNPTMADSALELAEECLEKLEKEIPSSSDQSTTKQDTSTEDQRNSFRVKCFRAEAALALSDEEKAWIYFQKAKERLHQLPQEAACLSMLSYNFGVDMFHRKKFDACVSWLRESYELGKCRRDVGPRKQSRTLRLLASSYMEWNVKEHWQKALNAVGLANSEFSHPTGLRLKLSILLATHAKDSRISAAFEETLNHPELDVTTGLSTVELAVRHKQVDLAYSGFKQLSVQFQNSPDFEQIQISHLELLLMEQNTQAAQDLLSDVIRDQRLSESLTVSARKKIHKLLWQQASAVCEAEQPAKALEWYDLSLRLFTKEELDSSNAAKLQRNRATCFISIADFKSAHDAILEAERSDSTNPITYYLKFKMNLLQGNSDSAVEAIEEMCNTLAAHQEISSAGSDDSNALISLAAQLAFEKSNHVAAEKALECLTERLRNDSQKLMTLRCLTRLKLSLLTDQSNTSAVMSILYYITTALETLSTTGKEKLNEDVYENETKWFMKIAWNLALQCQNSTKEMYDLIHACQKLAKLSRDHETSVTRQKTCLLLAAAAGLEMARQETNEKNKITTIVEVLHHIEQCQQLQMQATSTASVSHSNTDTLLLLYEFEAKAQLDYPIKELYELLEKANTLPGADAKTFETLAGLAVQSPVPHTAELALAALDVSISRYTNSNDIDLVKCSKVFRGAIQLCLQKDMKDANYIKAWNYYQQVLEIVETDRNETYPEIEVLWLLTKAWNHGIRQYSGGQCRDAEQWCGLGMRLLSKLTSMKSNYETQMAGVYSEILSKVEEHSERTNAKQ